MDVPTKVQHRTAIRVQSAWVFLGPLVDFPPRSVSWDDWVLVPKGDLPGETSWPTLTLEHAAYCRGLWDKNK
jgi:hypothetical protein